MRTLVIGGSASGKSTYAEILAVEGSAARYYIATMMPDGQENLTRIRRHRAMRAQKSFVTIECSSGLDRLRLPVRGTVLLEDVGNLAANELFAPDGAGEWTVDSILAGITNLEKQCDNLIIVSINVSADGNTYDGSTKQYIEILGNVNREIALRFDRVVEVVCGIPIVLKGADS